MNTSGFGFNVGFANMINNVVTVLQATITPIAIAVFSVGALLYIVSAGNEERKNLGKGFMIGALLGVGVAVAAKAILNFVIYFVYG